MNIATNCEQCIFADYSDSDNPCIIGIIEKVRSSKTIQKTDNNFNRIIDYRCAFAFSEQVYKEHITEIESIDNLKKILDNRAKISYYMVIFIEDDNNIIEICSSINSMIIQPKFVSFVLEKNNNTNFLIEKIKSTLDQNIKWKLHNLLYDYKYQEKLDIIFQTNTEKNDIPYFWINDSSSMSRWPTDIIHINTKIVIEQPFLHAMFRKNTDGLFLTFNNYQQILDLYKTDILNAISKIENKSIQYYG